MFQRIKHFVLGFVFSLCSIDAQFVSIHDQQFVCNDLPFTPLVINYAVNIRHQDDRFWISRSMSYFTESSTINCKDSIECYNWMNEDFKLIRSWGFNCLRIVDFEFGIKDEEINKNQTGTVDISYYYGPLKAHPFVEPFEDHFKLFDKIIELAHKNDLKIIFLTGGKKVDEFPYRMQYANYLNYLAKRYRNESTIMAFDLLNEPSYFHKNHSKEEIQVIMKNWLGIIRSNAPNIMTTIGLSDVFTTYDWDPELMEVDFLSFHLYPDDNGKMDNYFNQVYWISKISKKPWIIGETGFSASFNKTNKKNHGQINTQTEYFKKSIEFCLDCGGLGYSWWQFHDVNWSPDFGVLDSLNQIKPIANEIKKYNSYKPLKVRCNPGLYYYGIQERVKNTIQGKVIDQESKPVPNAIISAKSLNGKRSYTFSKPNGSFIIDNNSLITSIFVTAPGYKVKKKSAFSSGKNIKLKKVKISDEEILKIQDKEDFKFCQWQTKKELEQCLTNCRAEKECLENCKKINQIKESECKKINIQYKE